MAGRFDCHTSLCDVQVIRACLPAVRNKYEEPCNHMAVLSVEARAVEKAAAAGCISLRVQHDELDQRGHASVIG